MCELFGICYILASPLSQIYKLGMYGFVPFPGREIYNEGYSIRFDFASPSLRITGSHEIHCRLIEKPCLDEVVFIGKWAELSSDCYESGFTTNVAE